MTPHNDSVQVILQLLVLFVTQSLWAQSTPVFIQPNGATPTGHFDLSLLKKRAVKSESFEWLWVRDSQGHNGWVLKSAVLLPLDFSRQAILNKGEHIFAKPQNLPTATPVILQQNQVVQLIQRYRDWFKIIYKSAGKSYYGWVSARYLSPYSKDGGLFFSTQEISVRKEPKMKSKILKTVTAGLPMIPLSTKQEWAYVQVGGVKGYVPFRNIKSRMDVAIKVRTNKGYFKPNPLLYKQKVIEIFADPIWVGTGAFSVELKSKPDMNSNTVATVAPWQSLATQGYSIKKWRQSHVPRWGHLWWPESTIESNVEIIENFQPHLTLLKKSEIYQLERSPIVPGLQFASTPHGVYRSFDGQRWHPLKDFKNGFPIKVAKNGTLFVGDRISFDHGESFQHFIRWDKVFDSIPKNDKLSQGPIQILNVEPNRNNHKQVTLSLRVGTNKYIQLYTPNLGQNWRLR